MEVYDRVMSSQFGDGGQYFCKDTMLRWFSKVVRGKAKINKKSRLFHVFVSWTKLAKKGLK